MKPNSAHVRLSSAVEKQITLHYKPLDYMAFAVCWRLFCKVGVWGGTFLYCHSLVTKIKTHQAIECAPLSSQSRGGWCYLGQCESQLRIPATIQWCLLKGEAWHRITKPKAEQAGEPQTCCPPWVSMIPHANYFIHVPFKQHISN